MEHGEDELTVLHQAYSRGRGRGVPDFIKNAPTIPDYLLPFWEAFQELSTCRGYGGMNGVPTPIPWTAIDSYACRHRFAGEAYHDLVQIVRAVDAVFVQRSAEKVKRDGERPVQQGDG